jgi:hypothetical protein
MLVPVVTSLVRTCLSPPAEHCSEFQNFPQTAFDNCSALAANLEWCPAISGVVTADLRRASSTGNASIAFRPG